MLFSGYVYWLILSKITSPAVIGSASTIISLATLFTAVASVGVTSGIQRFLAKSIDDNDIMETKRIINTAILISIFGISFSIIFMISFSQLLESSFNIQWELLMVSILIMGLSVIMTLFRYIIIASLHTKSLSISAILSTISKIIVTILLVIIGNEISGILTGYALYFITSIVILTIAIKKSIYKTNKDHEVVFLQKLFKDPYKIFLTSIPFWIPNIINTAGNQLGTVAIFISSGATDAGVYFIALSIFTGISMITSVLTTLAYPTIGSLVDGRKRAVSRFLNLTLILTLPLSIAVIGYSEDIMIFFGEQYVSGTFTLQLLFLSFVPIVIATGVSILAYSYGNNRQVLLIGFFSSVPRILLYIILVPIMGAAGAALSFLIGSLLGFFLSIYLAKVMDLRILWKDMIVILLIPLICIVFFKCIDVNYLVGIIGTIGISGISLLKLNVLKFDDVIYVLNIFPKKISIPLLNLIKKFK